MKVTSPTLKLQKDTLLYGLIKGHIVKIKVSVQVTNQHQWVTDGFAILIDRDYINYHKVCVSI